MASINQTNWSYNTSISLTSTSTSTFWNNTHSTLTTLIETFENTNKCRMIGSKRWFSSEKSIKDPLTTIKLTLKMSDGKWVSAAQLVEYRYLIDEDGIRDGAIYQLITEDRLNNPRCLVGILVTVKEVCPLKSRSTEDTMLAFTTESTEEEKFLVTQKSIICGNSMAELSEEHPLRACVADIIDVMIGEEDDKFEETSL